MSKLAETYLLSFYGLHKSILIWSKTNEAKSKIECVENTGTYRTAWYLRVFTSSF